ncbi:glycosyltransferase [Exiguobacterium sp. s131]|uniref:glycosyltransferase family 2 protein n=1 Tax=Exiguobacterium sp. s131 TaxID=2751278 RepID=UPI001BECF1D6|nr:glycosyltransferase [Exiguobacterium sp. s131]
MVMVSIDCITYNHEPYIAKTIEGFLMQETDFDFEILIHEDASTDRTADIVREYEEQHPNLIRVIYQTENQYSQGIMVNLLNEERARGKYIALCDGDDYWTDPHKLQKQVDYMEAHPDCTLCFHDAYVETDDTLHTGWRVIPWMPENRKYASTEPRTYHAGELQLLGFIPTMSMLYRNGLTDNVLDWIGDTPAFDGALKLHVASQGYAYYMPEVMSVYRFGVSGSVTTKWRQRNRERDIERIEAFIRMMDAFDSYTNGRFHQEIEISRLSFEVGLHRLRRDFQALKSPRYDQYVERFVGRERLRPYLMVRHPHLMEWLIRMRSFQLG